MKKNLTLILFGFLPLFALSQIQQAFNYQAAVRNSNGQIQFDTTVSFKIEILQNGNVEYSENHFNKETGKTGVVNFKVGEGEVILGDFSQINWSEGQLQIRTTLNGEQNPIGTADIVAVPIALYAQNSGDDNDWTVDNQDIFRLNGRVGIGNSSPTERFVVGDDLGNVTGATSSIVIGNNDSDDFSKLVIGENEDNWGSMTWRNSGTATPHTMLFGTSTNGNVRETLSLNRFGRVGIGTTTPSERFVIYEDLGDVTGANAVMVLGDNNPDNISKIVFGEDENHWGGLYWANSNTGKPNSFTFQIKQNQNESPKDVVTIRQDGVTEVEVLQINGGGDGAEYFNIEEHERLEKGSLVIIDEENEGKLKISSKPYDTRIAGVISGAGGVNPGITLEQKEVLEGDELVSLWGRVYVKATTENGVIKPGDLLTSSNLEGHVMKATKNKKSRGAIIGKALSRLNEGEGLVLILIQPQ